MGKFDLEGTIQIERLCFETCTVTNTNPLSCPLPSLLDDSDRTGSAAKAKAVPVRLLEVSNRPTCPCEAQFGDRVPGSFGLPGRVLEHRHGANRGVRERPAQGQVRGLHDSREQRYEKEKGPHFRPFIYPSEAHLFSHLLQLCTSPRHKPRSDRLAVQSCDIFFQDEIRITVLPSWSRRVCATWTAGVLPRRTIANCSSPQADSIH